MLPIRPGAGKWLRGGGLVIKWPAEVLFEGRHIIFLLSVKNLKSQWGVK